MSLKRLTVLWLGACALLGLALLVVNGGGSDTPKVLRDAPKPAEVPSHAAATPPRRRPRETPPAGRRACARGGSCAPPPGAEPAADAEGRGR
ncbi:MAG: hypothetical protein IPI35_26040 [Deltaproteobacteria bacterium]|nr:hypothetical protein [Deltaproteobacteria bacterium]